MCVCVCVCVYVNVCVQRNGVHIVIQKLLLNRDATGSDVLVHSSGHSPVGLKGSQAFVACHAANGRLFVLPQTPVIALVGNDACWTQISREQVPMFGSNVACGLAVSTFLPPSCSFSGAYTLRSQIVESNLYQLRDCSLRCNVFVFDALFSRPLLSLVLCRDHRSVAPEPAKSSPTNLLPLSLVVFFAVL